MRFARWVLIGMTGATIGGTLYEAAFGDRVGVILTGLAISIAGVFLVAMWTEGESWTR